LKLVAAFQTEAKTQNLGVSKVQQKSHICGLSDGNAQFR